VCAGGGGGDVERHLAVFGNGKGIRLRCRASRQLLAMASTINDGPTVQARPSAHADTPHNNQMAVEAGVPVANQTQKYHKLAAK